MNNDLRRLMTEAARLTRNGRLREATQAIQRALRGGPFGASPPPTPPPADDDPQVLDGLTRVVDAPRGAPAVAETIDAPHPASAAAQAERWLDGSFAHQGRTLAYKLYLPPTADGATPSPRPLVMMLHGCTQGAADFAAGTRMNVLARDIGAVVVYPEQTQHANAQKCWNWFKPQHQQRGRGEPALLAALAQALTAEHHGDPARVYVAGLSAGGAMADIVGTCYPDVFAAVGVHSGLPGGSAKDVMSALSAMRSGTAAAAAAMREAMPPTIVFHGDADATVHVRNGAAIIDAARAAQRGGTPSAHTAGGQSGRGQRYTRTVHSDAAGRSVAEYWLLHGAGHAWSGGSAQGTYTDPSGADASAEMLRFFLAHPQRG